GLGAHRFCGGGFDASRSYAEIAGILLGADLDDRHSSIHHRSANAELAAICGDGVGGGAGRGAGGNDGVAAREENGIRSDAGLVNMGSALGCRRLGTALSKLRFFAFFLLTFLLTTVALSFPSSTFAAPQNSASESCSTAVGNSIESPKELVSRNGHLQVSLRLRNSLDSAGQMHYCYIDEHGDRSPTLRLRPGDLLVLTLKNELKSELKS